MFGTVRSDASSCLLGSGEMIQLKAVGRALFADESAVVELANASD